MKALFVATVQSHIAQFHLKAIELLKQKLDKEIEENCSYEQILKTSEEIDVLLTKYYLENIKNIT